MKLVKSLLLTLPLLLATQPALSQTLCGDRGELVLRLKKGYNESQHSLGLASNGTVFEVFTSAKGSWSLLVSLPNGQTCLMAAGEGWEVVSYPKGQPV